MTQLSKRVLFNSRIKQSKTSDSSGKDFYETPTWGTELMLDYLNLKLGLTALEPCNGRGSISNVLKARGLDVTTFDIDSEREADKHLDFLTYDGHDEFDLVITNPPFKSNFNWEFAIKSLEVVKDGGLVIMLGHITKLEGQKRVRFYDEYPMKIVLVHSKRYDINGKTGIGYAWFIWQKGYQGPTELKIL